MALDFDHVGIDVADLERAIAFYREAFELEEVYAFELEDLALRGVFLRNPAGWTIELFKRDGAAPHGRPVDPNEAHNMLGIGHFCLRPDDIHEMFARLIDAGATSRLAPMVSPNPELLVAYVSDPEGNLIELIAEHDPPPR